MRPLAPQLRQSLLHTLLQVQNR